MLEQINAIYNLLRQIVSGKFIQTGYISATASTASGASVSTPFTVFAVPFDNVPIVIATPNSIDGGGYGFTYRVENVTATQFRLGGVNRDSASQKLVCSYFAIDLTFLKQLFGGGALLNKLPVPSLDWGWY